MKKSLEDPLYHAYDYIAESDKTMNVLVLIEDKDEYVIYTNVNYISQAVKMMTGFITSLLEEDSDASEEKVD
jgi:hypothetical protein